MITLKQRLAGAMIGMSVLLCAFLEISKISVAAAENEKVSSTAVAEDAVYIYVRGGDGIQSCASVQIGTSVCGPNQISLEAISDSEIPVKTILLVDNSYSISEKSRSEIQDIMVGLIRQALPKEQFRIGTFSDKVTYLCDYTADKVAAVSCVEGIEYQNQDTYFSDVLFEVLTQIKKNPEPCFSRIIMFSDGADDNEIGYTNGEVLSLAGESGIPVYTVGVKGKNNSSELETMFAFSRAANAEYYLLDGVLSTEDILAGLLADQNNICICVRPDAGLLDGSHKKILLKLQTGNGEVVELTTSVDMPFAPEEDSQKPQEVLAEETEKLDGAQNDDILENPSLPTIGGESAGQEGSRAEEDVRGSGALPILAVAFGIILVAAAVIFIIIQKRKKHKELVPDLKGAVEEKENKTAEEKPEEEEKTVFWVSEDESDKTVGLWDRGQDALPKQKYIVLRSLEDPSVLHKVPIDRVVHIGRKNADIEIKDKYVSAGHCDIILRGGLLYIKDTGSANGTFYENVPVHDETPIVSGGRIRIGRSEFSVELIQE